MNMNSGNIRVKMRNYVDMYLEETKSDIRILNTKPLGCGGQGCVWKTNNPMFVIKIIKFEHPETKEYPSEASRRSFDLEVKIGEQMGSVISSNIFKTANQYFGAYIMYDFNYNLSNEGYVATNLYTYLDIYKRSHLNAPNANHPIYKKLLNKLYKLYALGYYHGDLHGDNIIVIHKPTNGNDIKDVIIFDFGLSFKRNNRRTNASLMNMWKSMRNQEQNKKNVNNIMYRPSNNREWFRKLNYNALVQNGKKVSINFRNRLLETNSRTR